MSHRSALIAFMHTLTAEVVGAVLVCVGTRFTGFRASGIGRLIGKVPTVERKTGSCVCSM